MKLNVAIDCFSFFLVAVLISSPVNATKYKFESQIVRTITEETDGDVTKMNPVSHSRVCESLVKADKLVDVCKLVVNNASRHRFRRRIKFVDEQQSSPQKIISVRSVTDANDKKTLPACRCPTNVPVYLSDGKSADAIKVIVTGRRRLRSDLRGVMPSQSRSTAEGKLKYIRYLKYLRMLKGRKHKKTYKFEFGGGGEEEASNFDLAGLSEMVSGDGGSGFLEGVSSFFGSLDLGGLDFDLGGF